MDGWMDLDVPADVMNPFPTQQDTVNNRETSDQESFIMTLMLIRRDRTS